MRVRVCACWQPKQQHMRKHRAYTGRIPQASGAISCKELEVTELTRSASQFTGGLQEALIARARARPLIRSKNASCKCASLAHGCQRTKPASPRAHPRIPLHMLPPGTEKPQRARTRAVTFYHYFIISFAFVPVVHCQVHTAHSALKMRAKKLIYI